MKTKGRAPLGWTFIIFLGFLFLFGFIIIAGMIYSGVSDVEKFSSLGTWGDFFGGTLNPILTFLTFTGVLITIILQKIELSLTRQEFQRSADALESQSRAIEKQNFESTFFQMLTLHNSIVNSIDLVDKETGVRTQGRDCFRTFYTRLNKIYRENQVKGGGKYTDDQVLELSYKLFWKDAQLELGHYFRFLYNMIKFVKQSARLEDYYIKLLRSQLSDQELLLLFYNCLSPQGEKFKSFAEEFSLFDNMPIIRLLDKNHKNRFLPSAYSSA